MIRSSNFKYIKGDLSYMGAKKEKGNKEKPRKVLLKPEIVVRNTA